MNGDGLGDEVSADGVVYCPWLLTGDMQPGTPSCNYVEGNGIVEATSSFTGGTITITAQGGHTICTLKYADNPAGTPTFDSLGNFWDVYLDRDRGVNGMQALFGPVGMGIPGPPPSPTPTPPPTTTGPMAAFSSVNPAAVPAAAGASSGTSPGIYYWDGDEWHPCSNQKVVDGFVEVTINNTTRPSLSDLTGQIFADGILLRRQYGGGGPTVGGEVMMVNKAQLITQWIGMPMRLMLGFAF
jgi:hypothetical protein